MYCYKDNNHRWFTDRTVLLPSLYRVIYDSCFNAYSINAEDTVYITSKYNVIIIDYWLFTYSLLFRVLETHIVYYELHSTHIRVIIYLIGVQFIL